jgi:hypothetical protein
MDIISVTCSCGRTYRVSDQHGGKRIRCRECNEVIDVPLPQAQFDDAPATAVQAEKPVQSRFHPPPDEAPPEPPRRKRRRRRRRESDSVLGISISPGVFLGLLMMLGAVVWFVLGLYLGCLFYYPPILFFIGLFRFVTALMGRDED